MIHTISFPGLGLTFTLNRVAFTLLGRPVYWYGIIIASGLLLAVFLCGKWGKRFGITEDQITDMMICAVPICFIPFFSLSFRLYISAPPIPLPQLITYQTFFTPTNSVCPIQSETTRGILHA